MADSKSGMNLPSRTSTVLTDLRGGISGSIQDTARLKQEWTSLGQVVSGIGSKVGTMFKGGGPGGSQSSNQIAPDPQFAGQSASASGNQVFSTPAQAAIGGGDGGGGGVVSTIGGAANYGGGSGGNGMFRNLSEFVSQNKTGAVLYGAGTALMGAQSTSDMVEAQLLMQRAAGFMPKDPGLSPFDAATGSTIPGTKRGYESRYEYARRSAKDMADYGGANDPMDAFRALAAAQSYGINGPNFVQRAGTDGQFQGSVMSGISNTSNLVPGMGLEGTTRAYGGMQRGRTVNMLKGVGINIRDEQGNMMPMDVIIDNLWKKITKDVSKDGRGVITEQEMLIAFQPGNSMDSMVQNMFGDDPLVYTAIKNGLIYKAKTGGAAITKSGVLEAGMTTNAVQTKQKKDALGTFGLGQQSNMGAAGYTGVQTTLNTVASTALTIDAGMGPAAGPLKLFNALAAMLQTAGGAGGNIGNSVMGFITAILGKLAGRAEGGPVGDKTPYIVGEKGPELFIPKTDGVIIPNDLGPTRHQGGGVKAGGDQTPLSNQKLRGILSNAGFTGQALDDAFEIARMESGGIPRRHSDPSLKKDDSHGLFQINMLGSLGEARRKKYGLKSDDDLYDPEINARVAYAIYYGSGKNPRFDHAWVTSSSKLADKGRPGFGPDNRGSGSDGDSNSSGAQTDNPFKGTDLEKPYAEYLKTNTISDSSIGTILGLGGKGEGNTGLESLFKSMAGGGSTINYGGVTFNVTTPADNKSFIESIKQALKDLNLGKLIGGK